MNIATLVTVLSQLSLAAAAYRLANRLAVKVEAVEIKVATHDTRLGVLERRAA